MRNFIKVKIEGTVLNSGGGDVWIDTEFADWRRDECF